MTEKIAYFSMEIGLKPEIPTYSGGLGILAGDTLKSCADMGVSLCAVTLLSEKGYFHQEFDQYNMQKQVPVNWPKEEYLELLPNKVSVEIEGRKVVVQAWKLVVKGIKGSTIDVYYLDTNLEENTEYDRTLTSFLYGGDRWYRMCQEIILGIAGTRMLKSLGIQVSKYHMNEGHAAFLILELFDELKKQGISTASDEYLTKDVKDRCVFTTHTPVPAGHDAFEVHLVKQALGSLFPAEHVECIHEGKFNMTLLALNHSSHINGVAKKHGEVSSKMFPGYRINAITNGVHAQTWVCSHFQQLFDKYIDGWREDNFMLRYALNIPEEEIWDAHQKAKSDLIRYVNAKHNVAFKTNVLTIGFARRFATYKRADLIFRDVEQLLKIHSEVGEIQIIMSGKAHPSDQGGIDKIKYIKDLIAQYNGRLKIVFLDNYEMYLARMLVSGCDIWLNTPLRPREASGTSGMKATLNGVLNFSVLDGWWIEGWVEGVTGWAIGPFPKQVDEENNEQRDITDLYCKLRECIVPLYYHDQSAWITMMKHSISHNGSFFNTQRMVSQYVINSWL